VSSFRDATALGDRARVLETENDALRRELALYEEVLGRDDIDAGVKRLFAERRRLVGEIEALRARVDALTPKPPPRPKPPPFVKPKPSPLLTALGVVVLIVYVAALLHRSR